ncbi:hypothetical protein PC9H_005424 [Pleurotus ostreatus]|uniref:Uncharacterized protein n=1 Tax=Pleurotus ostreatus TaxID=5322 RepID=A0A8H7A3V2_PLEOS|nr:uncharacterized protein PC9H_005424 [Pleurotus ostreatus]KAF7433472.1 hypothetical protein PC9H_005424 [Pleurotus ostreatus]KAJ8697822.1 hypothetical protein PTI98_004594 [Pleurotus ostreatus]
MQNQSPPSSPHPRQPNAHVPDYHEQAIGILSLPETKQLINRVINASASDFKGKRRPSATAYTIFRRNTYTGCKAAWATMTWEEKKPWYMASDIIRAYCKLGRREKRRKHSEETRETDDEILGISSNEAAHTLSYSTHEIGFDPSTTAPLAIDPVATRRASPPHAIPRRRDSFDALVLSPSLQALIDDSVAPLVEPFGSPPPLNYSGSSLLLSSTTWPTSLHTWTGPLPPLWNHASPESPPLDQQLAAGRYEPSGIPNTLNEISDVNMGSTDNRQVRSSIRASRENMAFAENYAQLLLAQNTHTNTAFSASDPLDLSLSQDTLFEQFVDWGAMGADLGM